MVLRFRAEGAGQFIWFSCEICGWSFVGECNGAFFEGLPGSECSEDTAWRW
jgi:hypothetical protein